MLSVSSIVPGTTASSPSRITTRAYSVRSQLRANMASATRIVIRAEDTGLWKGKQDEETAAKVSSLLQADLEKHHIFFNAAGFHNHLVHQLLALYGTGAPPSAIQAAFDANRAYQLGRMPARRHVVAELQADWAGHAHKYLGRGAHYSDFLRFFQDEMDRRGWEAVVGEFLCSGGDGAGPARHMVQRLFAGLAHPMIQLGFGLEWEQPAIMAQGLAQAAVHRNALGDFFDRVDEAARGRGGQPPRAISDICEALRAENGKLAGAAEWRDGGQGLYAGVLGRALDDAVALCAEVRVREHDFEERVAEVLHHGAYVAASASWKPPHIPKYDFYLIHALNASVFLLALDRPCFPMAARIRILEHKMRYDVLQYIARGAPRLSPSHIANYEAPGERQVSRPEDLLPRYHGVADDGHAIKVARSLLLAQRLSREWEGRGWLRLRGDNDWLKAHYMLLRSVEGQDPLWVRGAGFDQAWEGIPALS